MQCELVKLKALDGDPIIARMNAITSIGNKSADLIQRLLAFSSKQPVQAEVFRPKRVAIGMKIMLERLLGEEFNLALECDDDIGKLEMDATQLEQILLNLIINARDAMPKGGDIAIKIENRLIVPARKGTNLTPPGHYIAITVLDQGSGISSDVLERIYEPFFTTKGVSSSRGLGLATVLGIVTQNHGRIFCETTEHYGTSFEIILPRSRLTETKYSVESSFPISRATDKKLILLVDDNSELLSSISQILTQIGYRVVSASDGKDALRMFEQSIEMVDLVITDVVMPGLGGKELADRLRVRYPELPFIFVSGYTAKRVFERGVDTGDEKFLSKPFNASDLSMTVSRALNNVS